MTRLLEFSLLGSSVSGLLLLGLLLLHNSLGSENLVGGRNGAVSMNFQISCHVVIIKPNPVHDADRPSFSEVHPNERVLDEQIKTRITTKRVSVCAEQVSSGTVWHGTSM